MTDIIIIAIVVVIVGAVGFYLYRSKKRGGACAGCPYAKGCAGRRQGGCDGNNAQ